MVLRLWEYAKTILGSGKLQISYGKAEIGPKKAEFCEIRSRFDSRFRIYAKFR